MKIPAPGSGTPPSSYSHTRNVGDSAADSLADETFTSLHIELLQGPGYEPTNQSIASLEAFLEARLNKPDGIRITTTNFEGTGGAVLTASDVRALEDMHRTAFTTGGELAVFVLLADSDYDNGSSVGSVVGTAYRNTSIALYGKTIENFSNEPLEPSRTVLESTVFNHEIGHILGLVNAGTAMQTDHQDEQNGRHCDQEGCLMFWTAETGEGIVSMLSGGTVSELDDFCLADLRANGGK